MQMQLHLRFLAQNQAKAKEMEALNAMIITYNHEINNPLAIIYGNLGSNFEKLTEARYNKALIALERIKDLVSKIQEIDVSEVEYSNYTETTKMLKLAK